MNGKEIQATEIIGDHGNRIHKFDAGEGSLKASYSRHDHRPEPTPHRSRSIDLSTYLRPSRYAEADKFFGFAATEFGDYTDSAALLEKVSSWVGTRLDYVPGSSDPIDGAVDTLLAGAGVCRDYAHLVVALLRAVNVPARLVAVYAPGCRADGLPRRRRGVRRRVVAGGRCHLPGAAPDDGAHRDRPRRGRHRVPGQPQGLDHAEQLRVSPRSSTATCRRTR